VTDQRTKGRSTDPLAYVVDNSTGRSWRGCRRARSISAAPTRDSSRREAGEPVSVMQARIGEGLHGAVPQARRRPEDQPKIRRLNRLPIIVAIVLVVLFLGVIIYGLTLARVVFRR
jgi:hypothetical protein